MLNIRGRHASNQHIPGETKHLSTKIEPNVTIVQFLPIEEGNILVRIDDKNHLDFWMEFNLDISTLEYLLSEAKSNI